MQSVSQWLATRGVPEGWVGPLASIAVWAFLAAVAVIAYFVAHSVVARLVRATIKRTKFSWDDALLEAGVFRRLTHLVPALIVMGGGRELLADAPDALAVLDSLLTAYLVLIGLLVADALLTAAHAIYESQEGSQRFQIKTVVQVVKLVVFFFGGIAVIALLMGRSPLVLISGLGAFTAVLMLVFRDAILGFVAGIQLSVNHMVRKGDWIEMPSQGADGDVLDVSLTTVKVQNWDKTITTIPTYALVSDSFKNWRGMSESGGRRIKRSLNLDINSIRFCDREMLDRFLEIAYIRDYVRKMVDEVTEHNTKHGFTSSSLTDLINGRHLTNVGTFRAYIEAYLRNHPKVHQEMTLLVRQLPPSQYGLPIEIYLFSNDQEWANYEALQADIFDHLLAVAPLFDLSIFQVPSGVDLQQLVAARAADRPDKEPRSSAEAIDQAGPG